MSDRGVFRRLKEKLSEILVLRPSLEAIYSRQGVAQQNIEHMRLTLDFMHQIQANQYIASLQADPRHADPKRLERFGFKGHSQFDEDGILAEIFRRIGTTNRQFVEFGSGDGLENNTLYLLCQGWSGVWIDGNETFVQEQRRMYKPLVDAGRLKPLHAFVTTENINQLIGGEGGLSGSIDLLSIDIDGNDYYLFDAISIVRPRVVVIEYNAYVPPPISWKIPYDPSFAWDQTAYFNSSLSSTAALARKKGYTLVGCNFVGLNAFFVQTDLVSDNFACDGCVDLLYHPRRYWLDRAYSIVQAPYGRSAPEDGPATR